LISPILEIMLDLSSLYTKRFVQNARWRLDHIGSDFSEIQAKIFSGRERDMVNSISHIIATLLNLSKPFVRIKKF